MSIFCNFWGCALSSQLTNDLYIIDSTKFYVVITHYDYKE